MLRIASFVCLIVTLALGGCSSGGSNSDAAAGSGGGGTGGGGGGSQGFRLTSPAFTEDQPIPAVHTCAGAGTSPAFSWSMGPSGTMSYALLLTDLTPTIPPVQWVVWDIQSGVLSLPAALPGSPDLTTPPMSKQVSIETGSSGYPGPCPGGATHRYLFRLYALEVATLPNVTTSSTPAQVASAILDHLIDFADLVGTSDAAIF